MPYPSAVLDLPFFLLLEAWSPWKSMGTLCLHQLRGDPEQDEKQAWRLQWKLEQIVQYHFTHYSIPLCHIFFCYRQKSAKGRVWESWCSKWSSCWFRQSSHTSREPPPLAFCSTVLSPFLNPSQLPAGSTHSAVMSSTQSRCSSICVCVFFKLANLAVFP